MPCGNEGLVARLHVGNGDETYCPTFQWNETAVVHIGGCTDTNYYAHIQWSYSKGRREFFLWCSCLVTTGYSGHRQSGGC